MKITINGGKIVGGIQTVGDVRGKCLACGHQWKEPGGKIDPACPKCGSSRVVIETGSATPPAAE